MKDGFYLSAYLTSGRLNALHCVDLRHDHNVSLWEKRGSAVSLRAYWELERFSGQKHHRATLMGRPRVEQLLRELLATQNITLDEIVDIWGVPDLSTSNDYHWVNEYPEIAYHSLTHLFSAVLMDSNLYFNETILGFATDRGPDRVLDGRFKKFWFSGCIVRRGHMEVFPIESPGPLWGAARDQLGLEEGTLMALASASDAYGDFDHQQILTNYEFFGEASVEDALRAFREIESQVVPTVVADCRFNDEENRASAIIKAIQLVSICIMERNIDKASKQFAIVPENSYLALSGGFALNCPTNTYLLETYKFLGLLAPPYVGDDGQSAGIALGAFLKGFKGSTFDFLFPGPYLGRMDDDFHASVNEYSSSIVDIHQFDLDRAVDDLCNGPIAWVNGRSEVGPRALGNRSLLGDPRSNSQKDELNRIKRRQWWRPVAPIILEEHLAEWFVAEPQKSKYMLQTFYLRADRVDAVPGIAHLDRSARVQTLSKNDNPQLHSLVEAFYKKTGVPMLSNTSLNDKGEPIIDRAREGIAFCVRRGVDIGYFHGRRLKFREGYTHKHTTPCPRRFEIFLNIEEHERDRVNSEDNPHRLSPFEIFVYLRDMQLSGEYEIITQAGALAVRSQIQLWVASDTSAEASTITEMEMAQSKNSSYCHLPSRSVGH